MSGLRQIRQENGGGDGSNPDRYPQLPSWSEGAHVLNVDGQGNSSWEILYWQHIRQAIYENLGIYKSPSAPWYSGDDQTPINGFIWIEIDSNSTAQNWWRWANNRWESCQLFQRSFEWPNTTGINIRFQIAEASDIIIEKLVTTCYVTSLTGTNTYWENNLQPLLNNEINNGSSTIIATNTNGQAVSTWVRREVAGNGQSTGQKLFNLNVRKNNNGGTVGNLFGTGSIFYRLTK